MGKSQRDNQQNKLEIIYAPTKQLGKVKTTNLIFDDYNAIKPFNTSSAKSKTLINFLTVECNKWSSAYNDNQTKLKQMRKAS